MKWAHSLGSPGSSHASEAGIVITNHQAQRPCKEDGTNSPPWQAAMLLRWLNKMYESRNPACGERVGVRGNFSELSASRVPPPPAPPPPPPPPPPPLGRRSAA